MKFERMGRELKYSYHILQHGWNSYLRMLNVDYKLNFTCPICKDNPETLILDGITMGTIRELPNKSNYDFDEHQKYNLVPMSKRVYISNLNSRKSLKIYYLDGVIEDTFKELMNSMEYKEFVDFVSHSNLLSGDICSVDPKYPNAKLIIKLLARSEPITGLFQISLLKSDELEAFIQLSQGIEIDQLVFQKICDKVVNLKFLCNSFLPQDSLNFIHQPNNDPIITGLLQSILMKIDELNSHKPSRILVESGACNKSMTYFPAMTTRYK